ncbi:hypothetical protein MKW98_030354, partial [Papaver atlanticum]
MGMLWCACQFLFRRRLGFRNRIIIEDEVSFLGREFEQLYFQRWRKYQNCCIRRRIGKSGKQLTTLFDIQGLFYRVLMGCKARHATKLGRIFILLKGLWRLFVLILKSRYKCKSHLALFMLHEADRKKELRYEDLRRIDKKMDIAGVGDVPPFSVAGV